MQRSDNLCNFYVLPLLGLNKYSFGGITNFINSYLTHDLCYLIVELRITYPKVEDHRNFQVDITDEQSNNTLVFFNIEERWKPIVDLFVQGKYSQFTPEAKLIIKQKSGLKYKIPGPNKKLVSSKMLLALDKDEDLKKLWEQELNVKLDSNAELMDIPNERNFLKFSLEDTFIT